MLKNKIWSGIFLSIILLVFSLSSYAYDYTYTQQSGVGFFVGTPDKSDAQEDTNELRQIINDLGALLEHSKMNGTYPKDLTTGGTIQIPETGLKFGNDPANNDIAAYIAGEMMWKTKAELGIDLSLYYLKTEIDTLGEVETIYSKNITDSDELAAALGAYYLKTAIDTLGEVETIYVKDIIDSDELAALKFTDLDDTPANYTDQAGKYVKVNAGETALEFGTPTGGAGTFLELTDTPAAYDNGKYAKSTADSVVWDTPSGGYTNLTSFVDQTAWRVFYSNNLGDVIELALGTDGQYLKSTGATSAPIFDTPTGAGDMLKATYDADADGDIDVASGGTEKSLWTLYAIPYLSGTTVFGEIPIGTAEYALTVNAGETGYDWTLFDLSLYYLKTEMNEFSELQAIISDKTLVNTTDKLNVFAATTEAELYGVLSDVSLFLEDVIDDTTPQLGGDLDMNEKDMVLDATLTDDHSHSGIIATITVGETIAFGELLYLDATATEWKKADASVSGTMPGLAVALEAKNDGEACEVLMYGYIRDDTWDFTLGNLLYTSETAGGITATAPADAGDQIQRVGYAIHADKIFFMPSIDVGEI